MNKVSSTISPTIGIPGIIELSLKTEFANLIDITTKVDKRTEYRSQSSVEYKPEMLQIKRVVTKTIRVGGTTASETEERFIQSVPVDQHLDDAALHEKARVYISRNYGDQVSGSTARIVGNGTIFQAFGCFKRK